MSGQFLGGSSAKTSRAAPATWPLLMAAARSASLISSPRAALIMRTSFFIFAIDAALIISRVCGLTAVCREIKSHSAKSCSSGTSSTDNSRAAASLMNGSYVTTRISKASARNATSLPMRPRPTRPRVLPRTSAPDDDFSQRPSRIAASNFGSWRTSANNSAKVCSATLTELPPGVLMTRTPGGSSVSVAEHTFALLLALVRQLPKFDAAMREGRWEKSSSGAEVRGKTLGLIGLGRIGSEVASRAEAFDMRVVAFDPFISEAAARELSVELVPLDQLLAECDFISLHTAVSPQTRDMINAAAIAKMKKGVRIVNAARGELINEADLAAAIKTGQLPGASLDGF